MTKTSGTARPSARRNSKSEPSTLLVLPEGVDTLGATFRVPASAIAFTALQAEAREAKSLQIRSDSRGIRGVLRGNGMLRGANAHITLARSGTGRSAEFSLEFDLLPRSIGKSDATLGIADGIDLVSRHLKNHTELKLPLVGASFSLSLQGWEPTLPLPFSPVGIVDKMPGVPKICGLDFSFSESTGSHKLERAFITVYEGIDIMVIRMLISGPLGWDRTLPAQLIQLAETYIPVLARKRAPV